MTRRIHILIIALLCAGFFGTAGPAQAQLLEVKQTVFGMDCAPCAYGLEKRLKKIEGVEAARVSLNDGLATITLAEANQVRLGQIREAIRASGFSAEASEVQVTGTIRNEGARRVLVLGSSEAFVLAPFEDAPAYERLQPGRARVIGHVPRSEPDADGRFRLLVRSARLP